MKGDDILSEDLENGESLEAKVKERNLGKKEL